MKRITASEWWKRARIAQDSLLQFIRRCGRRRQWKQPNDNVVEYKRHQRVSLFHDIMYFFFIFDGFLFCFSLLLSIVSRLLKYNDWHPAAATTGNAYTWIREQVHAYTTTHTNTKDLSPLVSEKWYHSPTSSAVIIVLCRCDTFVFFPIRCDTIVAPC